MSSYLFFPPDISSLAVAGQTARFPVHRIYCVGQNYAAHAREMGNDPDREPPCFFSKPADAVTQSATVPWPPRTQDLHHEVELVVALGKGGSDIPVHDALDAVYGYAIGVDLTRRDLQAAAKRAGRPWDTAKGFDHSAPLSKVVPATCCGHPDAGAIELAVDGRLRQSGNLSDMIWSVPEIIAELSTFFELQPGDLIFTGTPEGVGALQPGESIQASIDGLGTLDFRVGGQLE
jgi:fumarylpyruvate hydrolase